MRILQIFRCSNKTKRDSDSGYKKCKPCKWLIYNLILRRESYEPTPKYLSNSMRY